MSVSVHAISLVYELRILRSRLSDMLARNEGVLIGPDVKDIKSCVKIIDNMIRKVERIGKIISELQAPPAGEPADPEAGVGS